MTDAASGAGKTGNKGTLLAVDGHSLAFRAFFALPVENFSAPSGQPTNAVWGFATMLAQVIAAEKPNRLAVAFDVAGGTFRNAMLPQYKGTRQAAPRDLLSQLPLIQRMLELLGVVHVEKPGYEGDDVIGTLATMGEKAGYRTLVLSGDRDAFQLVDDEVTVLYPGHHFKDLRHMTPQAIQEKYRVTPSQYPDLAALRGETADNIPGVPGVGDGFAAKWIAAYGDLDGILSNADRISGKKGASLREHIDQVRLNRRVNALVRDLDLGLGIDDMGFGHVDVAGLGALFTELNFGAPTRRRIAEAFAITPSADARAASSGNSMPAGLDAPAAQFTVVGDAPALQSWVVGHLGVDSPAGDAHNGSEHSSDANSIGGGSGECGDDVPACAPQVAHGWVLQATGSDKPGRATLECLALLAPDRHGVLVRRGDLRGGLLTAVQRLLDERVSAAIIHGYKEHRHMLRSAGLHLREPLFDTKIVGYLLEPDYHPFDVEGEAEHFLGIHIDRHAEATQGSLAIAAEKDPSGAADGRTSRGGDSDEAPSVANNRACARADLTRRLAGELAPRLDERRQYRLLKTIELPVSQVLQRMESDGASVNTSRLVAMRDQFAADARQAQEVAWDKAGRQVNLQSPKQLQQVLFRDMGLRHSRRTKSGSYTTNAAALQDMYLKSVNNERANTFLGALLRHRETNKLKQIVQTLLDAVNPDDGRIHTTYEQTVAATGRLSSVDPNLQNIPNRNATGREIRAAFVPGKGYDALLSSDYSQVELRIMADLSGDEALIRAFKSGADFHKYVASLVYDEPISLITHDQRTHVKAMSYGLAYGLSTYGLARQLRISPAAADVLREKYFATFGKVHDYLESLVAKARKDGYTETMFGRRRYFPGLRSNRRQVRDAAERAALNAPIQGSAADIMKLAMVHAAQALDEAHVRSRIILQIHDELVVEVAPGEAEQVTAIVRDAMEHTVTLAVPLNVSTGLGADWQLAAH